MSACAMQTFNNVTPTAWQSVKQAVATQYDIQITTDSGSASSSGFTVHWYYDAATGMLSVQCTDSPFWAPCSTINSEINRMVETVLDQHNIAIARIIPPNILLSNNDAKSVSLSQPLSRAMDIRASGDGSHIPDLLKLASETSQLHEAQRTAAWKLLKYDHEIYPSDGCAITLSILLQDAGISVPDTFRAFDLGNILKGRNWQPVQLGNQKGGDIGSTCGLQPNHGEDHIYLVLRTVNLDEMVVADNQSLEPHFRYASGKGGKTPTKFFLRAPGIQ